MLLRFRSAMAALKDVAQQARRPPRRHHGGAPATDRKRANQLSESLGCTARATNAAEDGWSARVRISFSSARCGTTMITSHLSTI
jgi:hypothetical protein